MTDLRMSNFDPMRLQLRLYHAEGSCSGVTLAALRRTELSHEVVMVDLANGEQRTETFHAVSPDGKVPALVVGSTLLTETPAILIFLDTIAPEAELLPRSADPVSQARITSDLVWCGATLHPVARGLFNPSRVAEGDGVGVRMRSLALAEPIAARCEMRLAQQPHWFGASWSIVDAYLGWLFALMRNAGLDLSARPALAKLAAAAPPAGAPL